MGHRTVKRVPLDFNWPLNKVWDGYLCHDGGPCPEEGKTCFGGSTAAGKWLDAVARLIAMIGSEAAEAPNAGELAARGRIYPHPYLEEWDTAPRSEIDRAAFERIREIPSQNERFAALDRYRRRNPPTLLPLTGELVQLVMGLGAPHLGGFSGSEVSWAISQKLLEVAGMPESWGVCPVCGGNADDPAKRSAAEAWKETEPPTGEGWQLWETCSEGSPVSPVFSTAELLADWAAENATVFASIKATRDQWLEMILGEAEEGTLDCGSLLISDGEKTDAACNFKE
jgi:hypothetical protein